jgi:hypothetical protein
MAKPDVPATRRYLKIRQVICVGTRVMHFGVIDRVTKKVQQWVLSSLFLVESSISELE